MLPVLWPQLTPGHYAFCRTRFLSASASFFASLTGPPGVRHNSFAAQPPDLLLRFYVYLSGFGLYGNLALRLALYPVSVRRLAGFATPLPPPSPLLMPACGSLHLAVNTCGGTFTRKNCAVPGTPIKIHPPSGWFFIFGHSPRLLATPKGVKTAWHLRGDCYLLPVNGSISSIVS